MNHCSVLHQLACCWAAAVVLITIPMAMAEDIAAGYDPNVTGVLPALPNDTMDASFMRVDMDLASHILKHAYVREKTSDDWRFAFDVGDGDFGAAIYGGPDAMRFDIGKNDITMHDYPQTRFYPEMSFPEVRRRLAAGDTKPVWESVKMLKSEHRSVECWGGRLTVDWLGDAKHMDYREEMNFWEATVTSHFKVDGRDASVSTFASHPAEVVAIRSTAPAEAVRVYLSRNALRDLGKFGGSVFHPVFKQEDGFVYLHMVMPSGDPDARDEYVIMLGREHGEFEPADLPTPDSRHEYAGWRIAKTDQPATLFLTVVSTRDVRGVRARPGLRGQSIVEVAKARIRRARDMGYEALRAEHLAWWRNYWRRSWVVMNEQAGEFPWYFSIYKAGSARRPGSFPPGYAAPWRGKDNISWGHLCFNYEKIKQELGDLVTNHGELLEPFLGTLWHTRKELSRRTQAYFGIDGLCYPHAMSSRATLSHWGNTAMNVGTAGEAVHHAWEYYAFTQDTEYLRRVGYPLLRDVAEFYRQYLQADENGQLSIFPSYFSEYLKFLTDTVTDQAMFRAVFTHAARAADILGVDADKAAAWRDAKKRLRPIFADGDGLWQMYDPKTSTGERLRYKGNWSYLMLYPIYPGNLVNRWNGPEALREQAVATYQRLLSHHPDVWDKSFSYIDAARMGDRDYYPAMLQGALVSRTEFGNLDTSPEIQRWKKRGWTVDTGAAFPAGVLSEFLINSQFDEIRLFPAMPLKGHYAFHSLRARGGFLVSSEFRDGAVPYALIKSLAGNRCTVIQPFAPGQTVHVRDLDTGRITAQYDDVQAEQPMVFDTVKGHIYAIERQAVPLEQVPMMQH